MNVFDLFAKISLDTSEYDNGLNEASSKSSSFASKIGGGLATMGKAAAAGLAATTTAVSALAKQSIDAYADFEQLEGGIETLFGDSAQKVMADANEAFKTAGMSANEYMETSIQSAAALINSLGGDQAAAADLMNMSITDMADNVNKMGTSMEAVQNAYRGFSRGNFTMLDNLALGFAGTKEGMQELLDKAQEISGIEYNIDSYADIVEAIHVVQTEMGITGTTAKEASETISGSLASLKSAWTNLIAGLGNDQADIDSLIDNVVDGAETVFNNILPVAEKALNGIGKLIEKLAPVIAERIPALVDTLLPILINTGMALLNGIISALPSMLKVLVEQIPTIMQTIVDTFIELAPMLIDVAFDLIFTLAEGLIENLPTLIPAVVDIILKIVDKLTDPDMLVKLIDAALRLIIALAEGILKALPKLIEKAPEIIENLVKAIIQAAPMLLEAGVQLIVMLIEGIYGMYQQLKEIGKGVFDTIKNAIKDKLSEAKNWGKDLIMNFIQGIKDNLGKVKEVFVKIGETAKDYIGFSEPKEGPLSNFHTFAPDMIDLWNKTLSDNDYKLEDQFKKSFDFSADDITANVPTTDSVLGKAVSSQGTVADAINNMQFVIPVYVGGDKVDEKILNAIDTFNFRSGGR